MSSKTVLIRKARCTHIIRASEPSWKNMDHIVFTSISCFRKVNIYKPNLLGQMSVFKKPASMKIPLTSVGAWGWEKLAKSMKTGVKIIEEKLRIVPGGSFREYWNCQHLISIC